MNFEQVDPKAAELIDRIKGQLLIALLVRLGGDITVPVEEVDNTGNQLLMMQTPNQKEIRLFLQRKAQHNHRWAKPAEIFSRKGYVMCPRCAFIPPRPMFQTGEQWTSSDPGFVYRCACGFSHVIRESTLKALGVNA